MFLNPEWQRRVTTIRFAGSLHVLSVLVCFFFHIPMLMVDWLLSNLALLCVCGGPNIQLQPAISQAADAALVLVSTWSPRISKV